ncbi:MAG: DEAD/DEAH box helicase [Bacteroidota bacterium]
MIEEKIVVKKWIDEAKTELDIFVKDAIDNKEKIHISAPVGTGKTSYAIDIINYYQDQYQFIVLEPLISITNQLHKKLKSKYGIDSWIYNSDTHDELEEWEESFDAKWTDPYLSTIDSAWKLFEDGRLDPENTIVIIDESHSFLTDTRSDFNRTVDTIVEASCPVIGFSATASSWVLKYLLKVDKNIRIETSNIPPKEIYQFMETNIPKVIAYYIKNQKLKKVVIWTETFVLQDNIYKAIEEVLPSYNIVKLNAKTRNDSESSSWNYLVDNDKLPHDANIVILNKVVQAGININDYDIDAQFLIGKFDPYGFQQYLGRCRNYTGEYYFMYYDYGEKELHWADDDERHNYFEYIQTMLNNIDETIIKYRIEIPVGQEDLYTRLTDGRTGYKLNKCLFANKIYSRFRDLHGSHLVRIIQNYDPNLVFHENYKFEGIHEQISAYEKAKSRNIKMKVLPKNVVKYTRDLLSIGRFYKTGLTHHDVLNIISESSGDARTAKSKSVLHVPVSRKDGLEGAIDTAYEANVSIQRLIVAATAYSDNVQDEDTMRAILDPSRVPVQTVTKLMRAIRYYNGNFKKYNHAIKKVLNAITPMMLKPKVNRMSATLWKKEIEKHFKGIRRVLPDDLSSNIFGYNLITTETKLQGKDTSKPKNVLKLTKVVFSYHDYVKSNKLYKFN